MKTNSYSQKGGLLDDTPNNIQVNKTWTLIYDGTQSDSPLIYQNTSEYKLELFTSDSNTPPSELQFGYVCPAYTSFRFPEGVYLFARSKSVPVTIFRNLFIAENGGGAPEHHTHDASDIVSGTIDIDRLPHGALDHLVKVQDEAARFALTTDDVQLGDTVQQLDTGIMYLVVDEDELDNSSGYDEYTAGMATAVPWSGVQNKPETFTPSAHTHTGAEITSAVEVANKLGTNTVGSTHSPIYLNNGVATPIVSVEPPTVASTLTSYYYTAIHNRVNSCKNLLSYYTLEELSDMVTVGTFDDIYVGDYIEIEMTVDSVTETVRWIVGGINLYKGIGDLTYLTINNVLFVAEDCFVASNNMHSTAGAAGTNNGFYGTSMYTDILPKYNSALETYLTSTHLIQYKHWLSNSSNSSIAPVIGEPEPDVVTNGNWYNVKLMLLSEAQVYGSNVYASSRVDKACDNVQLPLFTQIPNLIRCGKGLDKASATRQAYWLSNVAGVGEYCYYSDYGLASFDAANTNKGVRPYFLFR